MTFISIVICAIEFFAKAKSFPKHILLMFKLVPWNLTLWPTEGSLFLMWLLCEQLCYFLRRKMYICLRTKFWRQKSAHFRLPECWPHLYSVTLWAKCCCFFLHNFFMINNSMSQMLPIELNIFDLEYSLSYRYWVWCFALYGPIKKWYMVLRRAITSIISWQSFIERNPVSIEICVIWSFV